jgi:hypothetical protein
MPKIERKTQKIFGGNAESDQLAVFGSMITGTPVYNDDIETLQSEAYTEGWQVAVAANEAPFMEEMNGVQYGFSKQLAYLFQQGIAEWDAGTTYYLNSFCQVGGVIYKSMQDENINHSPADDSEGTYWSPLETGGGGSSGGGLSIGTIGFTQGAVDETKNLVRILNGQQITQSSITNGLFSWFTTSVTQDPDMATTEENWQSENTANGMCGKYVYTAESTTNYYAYSSGSTTYFTTSTEDSESVNVYNTEFDLQGTGSISSGVLTYNELTYNRASGSDDSLTTPATLRLPNYPKFFIGTAPSGALQVVTGTTQINPKGKTPLYFGKIADGGNPDGWLAASLASNNAMAYGTVSGAPAPSGLVNSIVPLNLETTIPEAYKISGTYYIQIATGQETEVNIRNEIELNNPFFFGMSNYFKFKPNSLSWLKPTGYYEPKAAHPDYYNWILENVNKGVEGFKGQEGYCFIATDSSSYYWWVSTESPVVGASVYRYDAGVNSMFFDGTVETLTSNGFTFTSIFEGSSYTVTRDSSKDTSILHPAAWITDNDFEINTSDETFKLPLKNGTEGMFGGGAVVGNGMSLGLTNGFQTGVMSQYADGGAQSYGAFLYTGGSGSNVGTAPSGGAFAVNRAVGLTTDPTKSGLVVANAGVVPSGWALYYYVGETVQNANLIDAGRMQEQITNINAPSRGYLVQSYVNGTSGYRVYSDGWCEQWGKSNSTSGQKTITLTKAYNSINFTVWATSYTNNFYGTAQIRNNKTIWIESRGHDFTVQPCLVRWLTMGYIS